MRQSDLFSNAPDSDGKISIPDAASTLNVSQASVRNWIKTGYLKQANAKQITLESLIDFKENVAGTEKLVLRANKSLYDSHDHAALSARMLSILEDTCADPAQLGEEYEDSLSSAHRNKEGIYYTPEDICNSLVGSLPGQLSGKTLCDPCCGSGNFLLAALNAGVAPENIYGYDTDPVAVAITRRRLQEATGRTPENIICADFLAISSLSGRQPVFDIIITNPPWGKKLPKEQRERYGRAFNAGRSLDTSSLFFFAALQKLSKDGYLSLLLPESYFNIGQFEDARQALLAKRLVKLFDFGKAFPGLITKARAFLIQNTDAEGDAKVSCYLGENKHSRLQRSFNQNPAAIINMSCTSEEDEVIRRVFSAPHITLRHNARWALGIVTGNNKKYCQSTPGKGLIPVYKGSEVFPDRLEGPGNYIPDDLSKYQQVAPEELYRSPEKIIYRFISSRLTFFHDQKGRFILNSANLLVPDDQFPVESRAVVWLFNSDILNWVFQKIYDTHKILRSDVERLPIFHEFLQDRTILSEEDLLNYLGIEAGEDGTFKTTG